MHWQWWSVAERDDAGVMLHFTHAHHMVPVLEDPRVVVVPARPVRGQTIQAKNAAFRQSPVLRPVFTDAATAGAHRTLPLGIRQKTTLPAWCACYQLRQPAVFRINELRSAHCIGNRRHPVPEMIVTVDKPLVGRRCAPVRHGGIRAYPGARARLESRR